MTPPAADARGYKPVVAAASAAQPNHPRLQATHLLLQNIANRNERPR